MSINNFIRLFSRKWFEIYSIVVCAFITTPFFVQAVLLRSSSLWMFHVLLRPEGLNYK